MEKKDRTSKIVLVTGGSRGIGKSIALNAAARGIGVILTYNSNAAQGQAVADTIKANGGKAIALQLDTSQTGSFVAFAEEVSQILRKEWGRDNFDYLVNNAGIAQRTLIKDTTEDMFDELVNVNFKGVFFLTQKLIPIMIDGGQVINISSGASPLCFSRCCGLWST